MSSLGFALFGSNQVKAADFTLQNIRRHYPDAYCVILSDKGPNYHDIATKHNAEYFHFNKKLGYPIEPYGWRVDGVLEFLDRFYVACLRTNTTHLMYVEEDVIVLKKLNVDDTTEIAGYKTCFPDGSKFPNTGFPERFIDTITQYSGVVPNVVGYGAGGGTVMKVSTFLSNYPRVRNYIKLVTEEIQDTIYPKIGWIDCFFTWFYLLCGKEYTLNTKLQEVDNSFDFSAVPADLEVASGWKLLYDYSWRTS